VQTLKEECVARTHGQGCLPGKSIEPMGQKKKKVNGARKSKRKVGPEGVKAKKVKSKKGAGCKIQKEKPKKRMLRKGSGEAKSGRLVNCRNRRLVRRAEGEE